MAYFGTSLANEITTALSRFRWLTVVSSNSLARFARENRDGAAIRRARDIDFLLDGAIQRNRNNLRATLRLLDLRADSQVVWARRFDRLVDDPLAAQEEISSEVAAQIDPVMLAIEAKRQLTHSHAGDTAYGALLMAIPSVMRLERDSFLRASEHLARAIALDPDFARAHMWFALWHVLLIGQGWARDPDKAGARAVELADRAVVLDPWAACVFTVAGTVRAIVQRNAREAMALHRRALELNPNRARGWAQAAITHVFLGEAEEAQRCYQRYRALTPLDPHSFLHDGPFSAVYLQRRDYLTAAKIGRSVTQLNPAYVAGYVPYLAALGHLGEPREAAAVLRRLRTIDSSVTVERCLISFPLERKSDREDFIAGLRYAGVP